MASDQEIVKQTRNWIERVIIGENFCPFAAFPFRKASIRYWILKGIEIEDHLEILVRELEHLTQHEEIETSVLIFPKALSEFEAYLDFLDLANSLLLEQGYEGIFQIASFHPNYQFAGTEYEDAANFTNRSPYPLLHLLREESVSRAIEAHSHTEEIPNRNIEHARKLGASHFENILKEIKA
ncbi:MAG: DUF1415 domain-containing protein [Bacteroidota bacterium]